MAARQPHGLRAIPKSRGKKISAPEFSLARVSIGTAHNGHRTPCALLTYESSSRRPGIPADSRKLFEECSRACPGARARQLLPGSSSRHTSYSRAARQHAGQHQVPVCPRAAAHLYDRRPRWLRDRPLHHSCGERRSCPSEIRIRRNDERRRHGFRTTGSGASVPPAEESGLHAVDLYAACQRV